MAALALITDQLLYAVRPCCYFSWVRGLEKAVAYLEREGKLRDVVRLKGERI